MRPETEFFRLCLFLLVCVAVPIAASAQSEPLSIDFAHEVVPILQKHCVACHGGREAKGSFSLNTRELLVDSGHIQVGKPEESRLIELILETDEAIQMPPADRERLTVTEVAILKRWIAGGLSWDDGFSFAPIAWEPPLRPRRPDLPPAVDERENPIDRILDADLLSHKVPRPESINDSAFLRRVSLDLIGLLPDPEMQAAFAADTALDKRDSVVRELLDDPINYADHWLTFFNDLLRNDYSGTGFITGGRQQISAWLYDALLTNKPFDEFARELIAPPTSASQGYIDGIRWRGEVSAGQTAEIQFAQSVSQSFLGINMKCASCHDSFIDRWKLDEAYGLAAIYSSRPMEIHRCDKPVGRQAEARWLFPELGAIDPAAPKEERLRQLAVLMTHPENGRFTRTIVNRLWYKLMGRGIVHPLDAMQTKPWNEDLLDALAIHLQDHKYDLKSVLYLIATSEAYQSECVVRPSSPDAATQEFVYQGPIARRLTAEQFLDAVWQITGSAPAAFDAQVTRKIVQEGPTVESESVRNDSRMTRTSLLKSDFLMRSLGRPMREQIVSMRPSDVTTLEAVDLTNGSTLADYLSQGATRLAGKWSGDRSGLINHLIRFALSRPPGADETRILEAALSPAPTAAEIEDVLWAIFMMPEFMLVR